MSLLSARNEYSELITRWSNNERFYTPSEQSSEQSVCVFFHDSVMSHLSTTLSLLRENVSYRRAYDSFFSCTSADHIKAKYLAHKMDCRHQHFKRQFVLFHLKALKITLVRMSRYLSTKQDISLAIGRKSFSIIFNDCINYIFRSKRQHLVLVSLWCLIITSKCVFSRRKQCDF